MTSYNFSNNFLVTAFGKQAFNCTAADLEMHRSATVSPASSNGVGLLNRKLEVGYVTVSILPIVSKLLERHIHSLIFKHLLQNCPISPFQWGFMPRRSTTSALCTLVHDWLSQLDNGNEICSIFFDVRKAFDSVATS